MSYVKWSQSAYLRYEPFKDILIEHPSARAGICYALCVEFFSYFDTIWRPSAKMASYLVVLVFIEHLKQPETLERLLRNQRVHETIQAGLKNDTSLKMENNALRLFELAYRSEQKNFFSEKTLVDRSHVASNQLSSTFGVEVLRYFFKALAANDKSSRFDAYKHSPKNALLSGFTKDAPGHELAFLHYPHPEQRDFSFYIFFDPNFGFFLGKVLNALISFQEFTEGYGDARINTLNRFDAEWAMRVYA